MLYQGKIFPVNKINHFMAAAMGALMAITTLFVGWFANIAAHTGWGLGLVALTLLLTLWAIAIFRGYQTPIWLIKQEDGKLLLVVGHGLRTTVLPLPLDYHFSCFQGLVGRRNLQYPALLFTVIDEAGNCVLAVQEDLAVQYRPPEDWPATEFTILKQLPSVRQYYRNLFSRPRLDDLKYYLDQSHQTF